MNDKSSETTIDESQSLVSNFRIRVLLLFLFKERKFLRMLIVMFILAGIAYPYPNFAMWLGFAFAGYSAIANDSIQTIGTFIASNNAKKWWHLWLFIGAIFVVTSFVSWNLYDGDVTFQRLTTKGFSEAPTSFHFLQLAAPLVLLFLTRLKMPVSTTFMLLSAFSGSTEAILEVTYKSLSGYGIAFFSSIVIWIVFSKLINRLIQGKPHPAWRLFQWLISGCLWAAWIMQDAANIAIFLPRNLNLLEYIIFASYIFFGLGILFYLKGDKIQEIVEEKTEVSDVRSATIIDLVYTLILVFFHSISTIPMSTTWVFIGLLGGRELAINLSIKASTLKRRKINHAFRLIGKDVLKAATGLVISIILAIFINENIREDIIAFLNL
jgi:phosphate/sulfate permease